MIIKKYNQFGKIGFPFFCSKCEHRFYLKGNYFFQTLFFFITFQFLITSNVFADRLQNEIAVFSALDKVTASIKKIEIPINQTAEFGSLKVKPSICYTNPPTEAPKTTSFVEIEELQLDGQLKKIFSGWMLAESPGLNPVEHPVFDIWLTGCANPKNTATSADINHRNLENGAAGTIPNQSAQPPQRRRERR